MPDATEEQLAWFNELCLKTASGDNAVRLFESRSKIGVLDLLPQFRVPTLVVHARGDAAVLLSPGHVLACGLPSAQFVEIDSNNHILLEHEPVWTRFKEAISEFVGLGGEPVGEDPAFAALSRREREILALKTDGLANAQIADQLSLSEKTVRNHVSHVFDKLRVWSRAQAIVFARDRHFVGVPKE